MVDPYFWSVANIILILAVLLLAGIVKGLVGLGLPTVSLGCLTAFFDLNVAITLMLVPSFATNLFQSISGGAFCAILRRLWPLLIVACVSIWASSSVLATVDLAILSAILGICLLVYGSLGLKRLKVPSLNGKEKWLSPLIGAVNGALTGITGSFVVPGVFYLQALGWPRDVFVQAMGVLFTVSTVALAVAMSGRSLLSVDLGFASFVGLLPAFLGMLIGQRMRKRLSEALFRDVFFIGVIILGIYILMQSIF